MLELSCNVCGKKQAFKDAEMFSYKLSGTLLVKVGDLTGGSVHVCRTCVNTISKEMAPVIKE